MLKLATPLQRLGATVVGALAFVVFLLLVNALLGFSEFWAPSDPSDPEAFNFQRAAYILLVVITFLGLVVAFVIGAVMFVTQEPQRRGVGGEAPIE